MQRVVHEQFLIETAHSSLSLIDSVPITLGNAVLIVPIVTVLQDAVCSLPKHFSQVEGQLFQIL